jgi:phage I-like protein
VKKNFDDNVRKIELAVDENHEPHHKALAWYRELIVKDGGETLFAKLELTPQGAKLLSEGAYKYFSPEIYFKKQDEETGEVISNLLIGGAFTNRPFFKAMKPLLASED